MLFNELQMSKDLNRSDMLLELLELNLAPSADDEPEEEEGQSPDKLLQSSEKSELFQSYYLRSKLSVNLRTVQEDYLEESSYLQSMNQSEKRNGTGDGISDLISMDDDLLDDNDPDFLDFMNRKQTILQNVKRLTLMKFPGN